MLQTFELSVLSDPLIVWRGEAAAAIPEWALHAAGFVTITRSDDELSIICGEQYAPAGVSAARWRALKVQGPLPFNAVGVLSSLAQALADASVSILAVSTHDTDYLFVHAEDLARSVAALQSRGHVVHSL